MRVPLASLLLWSSVVVALAAQSQSSTVSIAGHVVKPVKLALTDEAVAALRVPDGFRLTRFAEGLVDPRIIAVASDGAVYVTRRDVGDVLLLRDANGDGRAEPPQVIARRPQMHGVAVSDTQLFLVTVTDVFVAERRPDGRIGELRRIIDDLPHAGQHPNRTIAIGPDGMLYISVGSTCNACAETSPEHATIVRAKPDGSSRVILASGLRNTIGFDWHPVTGELFGMDHGIDWLGDDEQPEELNRIALGRQYGWPYIYADGKVNPQDEPPGQISPEQWARMSEVPVLTYTAHAAPMQMAFTRGTQFPPAYRHDAFVAMRGSWNRRRPSGYEVVRIRFEQGKPVAIEPFLTGFLAGQSDGQWGFIGRPVGLAFMPDGSLLVGDDENGVIYRVTHEQGTGTGSTAGPAPSRETRASTSTPAPTPSRPLALNQLAPPVPLQVTSPALASGGPIPAIHSDYGEKISPALRWAGVPPAATSLVVMMEDPDAAAPTPFVHWILYNLPATMQGLPDAIPPAPRLEALHGALQGRTSKGSIGYFGPRPPKSAGAHRYHIQVFALDRMLSLDPGASAADVIAAMRGHVVAAGELVGTFKAPQGGPE